MGGSEVRSFLISYFITALCVCILLCHLVGNSRLVINLILTRNAISRAIKQRNHAFVNLALIFYFPDHLHVQRIHAYLKGLVRACFEKMSLKRLTPNKTATLSKTRNLVITLRVQPPLEITRSLTHPVEVRLFKLNRSLFCFQWPLKESTHERGGMPML